MSKFIQNFHLFYFILSIYVLFFNIFFKIKISIDIYIKANHGYFGQYQYFHP